MFKTEKIYYQHPFLLSCETLWRRVNETTLALARSIAFPEGGGQLGDKGWVSYGEHEKVEFVDTQKSVGRGRTVIMKDFPVINVEGEVHIKLASPVPEHWDEGHPIGVHVDQEHRSLLTLSHSISHLVYIVMTQFRPDVPESTKGCLIRRDGGRFDVSVERYTQDEMERINSLVADLVDQNLPIVMTEVNQEPECRYWNIDGHRIACGGTHLDRTGHIGQVVIKRKSQGKGLERIYYEFVPTVPPSLVLLY